MKRILGHWWPLPPLGLLFVFSIMLAQNCTQEKVVIYGLQPDPVTLVYPASSYTPLESTPDFTWRSIRDVAGYQIQVARDAVFLETVVSTTLNDTVYTPAGELEDYLYYWRVRAKNGDGYWGDWSDATVRYFRIGPFPADHVTLAYPPRSSASLDSMPTFSWYSLSSVDAYQLQVAEDEAFLSKVINNYEITDTFYVHGSALADDLYYWRVRAHSQDAWGDWSEAMIWYFRLGPAPDNFVTLLSPPNSGLTFTGMPQLVWELAQGAVSYQVQVSNNSMFTEVAVDRTTSDTTYSHDTTLANNLYYWRVRAKNGDNIWGDWSEAMVWSFRINDNSLYIGLIAIVNTFGVAQDVLVLGNRAYVADGPSEVTVVDVTDPANPLMVGNVDTRDDDFAKSIWKIPGEALLAVGDMDGKIRTIDITEPLFPYAPRNVSLGWNQNVEEVVGTFYPTLDTICMFVVSGGYGRRMFSSYQMAYESGQPYLTSTYREIRIPADGKGVDFDSLPVVVEYRDIDSTKGVDSTYYEEQMGWFAFAAVAEAGLWWFNVSLTHTFDDSSVSLLYDPREMGWADTPGSALSLFVNGRFVHVADDRGGLQIFEIPDTIPAFDSDAPFEVSPILVGAINTSGRTKDVHVVGSYSYLADGSGGLKIIDMSNPYAPTFVAAYTTPYAYGVWADEDYVYLADRDNGLMIFENRVF